jgi:hypothetical protein
MCDGTVIVHLDRSATCTNAGCDEPGTTTALTERHDWFVPCTESLAGACPRCL